MWPGFNGRPGIQKGPKLLRLSPWRTELGLKLQIKHAVTPKCQVVDKSHEVALISRAKCPQNYLSPETRL